MSNQLLASKLITKEEKPRIRNIPRTPTAVIAVEGVSERGPVNDPQFCASWEEFVKVFGTFTTDGDLPSVVHGIYSEDPGAFVYANRVVHYTDPATPATIQSLQAEVTINGTGATAPRATRASVISSPDRTRRAATEATASALPLRRAKRW